MMLACSWAVAEGDLPVAERLSNYTGNPADPDRFSEYPAVWQTIGDGKDVYDIVHINDEGLIYIFLKKSQDGINLWKKILRILLWLMTGNWASSLSIHV
jgi:hypothetical protein